MPAPTVPSPRCSSITTFTSATSTGCAGAASIFRSCPASCPMAHRKPPEPMTASVSPKRTALLAAARERILVLDGAMGTMIQSLQFDEAAFRGARFADFHRDVRGNNDLLILTQPDAIED